VATPAQIKANRSNAQQSTGPSTEEGKAKSRMNAVKWGLSSTDGRVLLPTESPEEFDAYRNAFLAVYQPVGALEEHFAIQAIELSWRLRRATKIERGILARGVADADERFFTQGKRRLEITERGLTSPERGASDSPDPEKVVRIANTELYERLDDRITEARVTKETDESRLAAGFIEDAIGPDALGKLNRYETSIFRRLIQTLATLQALQAARPTDTDELA